MIRYLLLLVLLSGCAKPQPPTFLKAAPPAPLPQGWFRVQVGQSATLALPPGWQTTDLNMAGLGGGGFGRGEFGLLGNGLAADKDATGFLALGPNSSVGADAGLGLMLVLHYDSEGKRVDAQADELEDALQEESFLSGAVNRKDMPLPVGRAVRLRTDFDLPMAFDQQAQSPRLICYLLEHGETSFAVLFFTTGSDDPGSALSPRDVMETFRLAPGAK